MLKNWVVDVLTLALLLGIVFGGSHWVVTDFRSDMKKDTEHLTSELTKAGMPSDQVQELNEALSRIKSRVSFLASQIFYVNWFSLFAAYLVLSERTRRRREPAEALPQEPQENGEGRVPN